MDQRQDRELIDKQMLSGLCHEIRQPLSAIVNEGQACRHLVGGPPEVIRQSLDRIVDQALRATELVRRLRHFTHRCESHRQQENLARLVANVVRSLQGDARTHGVELRWEALDGVPPVPVDGLQIEQVLTNLVRNAMEAIDAASPNHRLVTIRVNATGDEAVIAVEDTGPGISDEVADRLFETYFTTKKDGMGLGLPISRSIVEDHGGRLEVDAAGRGGGVFRVTLPLARKGTP